MRPTSPSSTTRRLRIAMLTYGSRGDVEPFVALGAGLLRAGHMVRLAAPRPYGSLARDHGIEFVPIESDPEDLALALTDRAGLSWPRMIYRMARHVLPLAASAFRAATEAADDADLILHSFMMTDAGHMLALRRGVPDVSAQLFPVFLPTTAFPGVAFPDLPLGPAYRRLTHAVNSAVFRYGSRMLYRRVRQATPGLPEISPWPFSGPQDGRPPILLAYSPLVLPPPADWPKNAWVTGYWSLDPPTGWAPPGPLMRFLDAGPPPVYFGVGSMRTRRMKEIARIAVEAIQSNGLRGVLGFPPQALDGPPPEMFFLAEGVPHRWLLPRMRAVVHHGGAGTTGAALRAGVPSVAVPFTADQAFWGRRIHRLQVGPAPLRADRLTVARAAAMVREAVSDHRYRTWAADLGRRLRAEDGVATAIDVIHRQLDPDHDANDT